MKEVVKDVRKVVEINSKLTLHVMSGEYEGSYHTRIEDIEDDKIYIATPSDSSGKNIPLVPKTVMDADFIKAQGRYRFRTRVLGRSAIRNIPVIIIQFPDEVTKEQLREFFRVDTRIKAKIYKFYSKVPDDNLKIAYNAVDATVVDISGGGCRFTCNEEFDHGQILSIDLSSAVKDAENIKCVVVRKQFANEAKYTSVNFKFEKESERNSIVQYVFKRQIELRQLANKFD